MTNELTDSEVVSRLGPDFDLWLRGIPLYMHRAIRECAARALDNKKITFASLDDNGLRGLVSEAYIEARDMNWAEILHDKHLIASKPTDVWNPDLRER